MTKTLKPVPTKEKIFQKGRVQLTTLSEQPQDPSTYKQIVHEYQERNYRLNAIVSRLEEAVCELTGETFPKVGQEEGSSERLKKSISAELMESGVCIDTNISGLFALLDVLESHIM